MEEEAKAAQEIAKATGTAIDAIREFGGFIARFTEGSLREAFGIIEDKLKFIRFKRALSLRAKTEQLMLERGLTQPTRAIPLKIAIPLLEEGSMEEDDDLQELWAALLVNAADARVGEVKRMHVNILTQLTSLDVQILSVVYGLPDEQASEGVWSRDLPTNALLSKPEGEIRPSPEVELSIENLVRVGCLRSAMAFSGASVPVCVYPTPLGRSLVSACSRDLRSSV